MESSAAAPSLLVKRIIAGERAAESEFVDRYSRGLRILITRHTRDQSYVDDIHQDLFRIAIERLRNGELREPEKLNGFLCGLARNLAIGYHRRNSKQPAASDEATAALRSAEPDPSDCLLADERARMVHEVLDGLETERQRQILQRFYIREEPKESICRDLGLTSLHFNRVLYNARERYKEIYLRRESEKNRVGLG